MIFRSGLKERLRIHGLVLLISAVLIFTAGCCEEENNEKPLAERLTIKIICNETYNVQVPGVGYVLTQQPVPMIAEHLNDSAVVGKPVVSINYTLHGLMLEINGRGYTELVFSSYEKNTDAGMPLETKNTGEWTCWVSADRTLRVYYKYEHSFLEKYLYFNETAFYGWNEYAVYKGGY